MEKELKPVNTRKEALKWWRSLGAMETMDQLIYNNIYNRNVNTLTGREIEIMWRRNKSIGQDESKEV